MRSAVYRTKKYAAKISGDVAKQRIDGYGETQKNIFKTSVSNQVAIEQQVRAYLATQNESSMLTNYYILFAKNMAKVDDNETQIEFNKWAERNLSWYHLRNIGRFIFNRRLNLMRIDTDPAMVLHQTLFEGSGNVIHDLSGNSNNGTNDGATWATGVLGNALSFDGSNDIVTTPDSPTLRNAGGSGRTLMFWVKMLADEPTGASNNFLGISSAGNRFYFYTATTGAWWVNVATSTQDKTSSLSIAKGEIKNLWTHFALVYDGANFPCYKNGARITNPACTGTFADIGVTLKINISKLHNCIVDEVKLFNRALTAQEILNIYNAEKPAQE